MQVQSASTARPSLLPWLLAGLLALAVAMGIGRFAFTPLMPMMMRDHGLTIANGGLLASANYLGYLVGALLAGMAANRESRVIRYGLLAVGILTLAMAADPPMPVMLALRFGAGLASALVLVAVSAWSLAILTQHGRPHLNGVVFTGVGSGVALAGLLCLAMEGAGSRAAWATLGVAALAVPLLLWKRYQPAPTSANANAASRAAGPASPGSSWTATNIRLVICYGLYGYGYIIPATFLPVMAKRALENPALVGWAWPVFGAAGAASTLLAAALSARIGARRLWILAHIVMALGVALPAWHESGVSVFISALFVGSTFVLITVCAMQEAKRLAPARATPLMAAMTAAFAAGQVAGPLSISLGLTGSGGDFSPGLWLAAALLAGSAAALALPDRPHHDNNKENTP